MEDTHLECELVEVLLPVIRRVDTGHAIGSEQPHAESRVQGPPADVDLAPAFIRENNAPCTEDVGLDVHLSPCLVEMWGQAQIEFVRAGGIWESAKQRVRIGCLMKGFWENTQCRLSRGM